MARKAFKLDKSNGKVLGVCAGIADYTGLDVTIVRVAAVVVTVLGGFPWTMIAYGAAALLAQGKLGGGKKQDEALPRTSARDVKQSMRDIDQRMAAIDTYVAGHDSKLSQEIEQLR